MASMQKLIVIGYLGKDPETRFTPSGTAVCTFSVATTEKWKDKQTQEPQERTEWHRVEAWGRLAEVAQQYLHKGDQVYLEGKLRTEQWEKDGQQRQMTKVRLDQLQFLNTKSDRPAATGQQQYANNQPSQQAQAAPMQGDLDEADADIPF